MTAELGRTFRYSPPGPPAEGHQGLTLPKQSESHPALDSIDE
ncbi:hypothetical protein D1AOALGA4SA_6838 [Olavius algarvensis Delta 1 endosymbiont]|nr:hypothetical protein D1AOALGA4SA_6838 [Olavius algarvensis Delta 1 endosymbiont]